MKKIINIMMAIIALVIMSAASCEKEPITPTPTPEIPVYNVDFIGNLDADGYLNTSSQGSVTYLFIKTSDAKQYLKIGIGTSMNKIETYRLVSLPNIDEAKVILQEINALQAQKGREQLPESLTLATDTDDICWLTVAENKSIYCIIKNDGYSVVSGAFLKGSDNLVSIKQVSEKKILIKRGTTEWYFQTK